MTQIPPRRPPASALPATTKRAEFDALLALMQHQDRRRSQVLTAIESKAPSAKQNFDSLQNHFQTEHLLAQRAHKFR